MRNRHYRRAVLPAWMLLFLGVLRRRPDRAFAIAYWYLTRRRVRARNRLRQAASDVPEVYKIWVGAVEQREVDALGIDADRPGDPTFSLLIDAEDWTSPATLADTIGSIRSQIGVNDALIVMGVPSPAGEARANETYLPNVPADAGGVLRYGLAAAKGDFVIIVPPDALLPAWALARYREAAQQYSDATILYGDEDLIDGAGARSEPFFKPRWNAELILAQDYISRACAIATPLAQTAAATVGDLADNAGYAILLAATSQTDGRISHIPHILCHERAERARADLTANLRVLVHHLAPLNATAEAGPFETARIRWPLPDIAPSVTIIIPTRDQVALLDACVGSLLRLTDYADYDVVVVDNGSVEPQTKAWFEMMATQDRVSVLSYDRPYNYSAINNFAAARARGQYLCLLNNDTEIIDGTWLREMMRYAVRSDVGAVGAKLLYGDRSIQHAGVVTGLGNAAGHAHRALPDGERGYFALAHCPHDASAVTAACLVVERGKFAKVGGLDETHLQIAYNDVDLCLKLANAGWRNVYAPQAVLIHYESKSRGLDLSPQHLERYQRELAVLQQRWRTASVVDPMHHPRLDRTSEMYRIWL